MNATKGNEHLLWWGGSEFQEKEEGKQRWVLKDKGGF